MPELLYMGSLDSKIVYLSLVTSLNGDYQKSSPDYLLEKARILELDERDAYGFGYLDIHNQRRACDYCHLWHLPVPEKWRKELDLQEEAEQEWAEEGRANYLRL